MSADASRADRLDRASPLPLWAQLLAELRARLGAGEFDERFPAELELAADYGVSRNTAREALRRLRSEGTLVSGRGRRPRLNPGIRQPLGAFYSLYESVAAAGLTQRSVVRSQQVRKNPVVARRLGLSPSAPLVAIDRVRIADDEPLALDEVYLPEAVGRPLLDADLGSGSLYEHLARLAGVRLSDAEETLGATTATAAQAEELRLPAGVGLLSIERIGWVDGRPVEWRRTLVRGDRFSLVARFSLAGAPDGATPGGLIPAAR